MSWDRFYPSVDLAEVPVVEQRLADWGPLDPRWKRIAVAIESDGRIHTGVAKKLGHLIATTATVDLLPAMRTLCQANTLQGKPASKVHYPLVRATKLSWLADAIASQALHGGHPWSEDDLLDVLIDLEDPSRWRYAIDRLEDAGLRMTRWLAWATFSMDGKPPFAGMTAKQIACDLGFDEGNGQVPWPNPEPLLLLTYEPPITGRFALCIPSAIEAIASDPLNYYFTPGPAGSHVGWTQPWANQAHPGARSRPEVVHDAWSFRVLLAEVREVL